MSSAAASKSSAGTKRRIRIWGMCLVLFLCWAAYTFFGQMEQQGKLEIRLTAVQQQLEETTKTAKGLQLQIDQLNDPEYIEQLATKEQGMVKKGERSIQVIK
ncbi:septum formation initiator family protein [Paenibacillus sp. NPDC058071]|uniref:FtsB family cell division protein n=1 Tax=Paenibacillus sp. NPDC058071 TaxID=3346326 RepID=UPI0036D87FB6